MELRRADYPDSTKSLDADERHSVALFNEVFMELHQPAFGKERKLGRRLAERDHTEIPLSLPRSGLQPSNICRRMIFLEENDYLFPVAVVHAEE
jgi:hypothetical protein